MGSERSRVDELEAAAIVADARIAALVEEVEDLHAAMEHRSVIEQAKGILMSTMQCSADAAFAVLVAASQRENAKLRDIAERLAASQDQAPSEGAEGQRSGRVTPRSSRGHGDREVAT